MSKIVILGLLLLLAVLYPGQAATYYVSSSSGSDSNPGTRKAPLRTLGALGAERKTGSTILLKAGDIFFEPFSGCTDCTISSYGKGRKPIICGFRIQKDAGSWVETEKGIWRLDMSRDEDFYGFPHGTVGKKQYFGNIGCLWTPEDNRITGNRVAYCRQGFEHWATTDGDPAIFEDCCFNDNILFCCGDNQFEGTPKKDNDVALLAYKAPAEYFEIKGNLIYGKNYRFNEGCTPGVGGGEVYILSGSHLLYIAGRNETVIHALGAQDIDTYRALCGDDSRITLVEPGSPEDMRARTKVSRALKFKDSTPPADELRRYE